MSSPVVTLHLDANGKLDSREVYDVLMAQIEPDLVESMIPTLVEKYKGESSAEKKVRAERYEKAFVEFDAMLQNLVFGVNHEALAARKEALRSAEAESRAEDVQELEQMESLFSDTDA